LEIVAAPDFEPAALEILKKKKNLRIIKAVAPPLERHEYIAVDGGLLVQETDRKLFATWEIVSKAKPEPEDIRDLDLAWKAVCAFGLPSAGAAALGDADLAALGIDGAASSRRACCVAVKHNTPCGIALGTDLAEAYAKTYACDPVSIFGGIVAVNVPLDRGTAEKLGELFLEIVAAPDFEPEALEFLKK
jgi:AICAR transformylase/IMP cyclohydrolase PurH